MPYSIQEIATIIGADIRGTQPSAHASVNWLLTDSRSLCFPEETLFFALRTQRNDGHRYIEELQRRGVKYFVVEKEVYSQNMSSSLRIPMGTTSQMPSEGQEDGAVFLVVSNPLRALQDLAAYHRQRFQIPVIAITGSNGKTTVKEWLYQLLSPDYNVCRSPRSYNSQVGVPLSLWLMNSHTDIAVFEAGISDIGEMEQLNRIIRPTIAVLTNVGEAHQENFPSYDVKCSEKLQLVNGCQTAVLNMSDNTIAHCSSTLPNDIHLVTWNTSPVVSDSPATILVRSIEKNGDTTTIHFSVNDQVGQYTIPFIDEAAIQNSVTCFATCLALSALLGSSSQPEGPLLDGELIQSVLRRMATLDPVAMRMEVKDGVSGCTLINDTYNSDVHSLDIALDFMNRRPDMQQQRRTLILSDILQSGESPRSLYSRVAQMAQNRGIQKFIGVGDQISECADFFPMESHFFHSTDQFLRSPLFQELHDEFILIKGARQFHFDDICDRLTLRVHQTILEVNLNALVDNLNYYRSFLSADVQPKKKMVCMVKASAYGIGAIEASKTLQDHGVDYLAVAVADEGAELRKAGITANIMVMNPEMTSFKMLFDERLEPEIYNFELLEALIRAAEKEGITNFPVHIKLDTGMHRLGFHPVNDMDRLLERLCRQNAVIPCSVFSHFVGSDDDGFDDFSREQFQLYDEASRKLQAAYSHHIIRHICNSAGIEHFPEYHLDMVRLGLGLYGINPRNNQLIHNVATLKTTILQIRDVPAGDSIGYSRKTFVNRPSRVAAIPIGYADGLNRRLGNRNCYCLVNGKKAPYLGNICMDVCMIDVTDIDCKPGDYAVVFGDDLPVTVLSDAIGTIPYEILTGISTRVQRVYVQE